MSSSEDEAVRRPGRGGRAFNGDLSDDDADGRDLGQQDEGADNDDDKDLFGSDSEAELNE